MTRTSPLLEVVENVTPCKKLVFPQNINPQKGTGAKQTGLYVPYKNSVLSGDQLENQIDSWVRKGVIELSTGQSMLNVVKNEQWTDLSDTTVVLCGAGSAMGPYPLLMAMGANVVALDLPRSGIWKRLIKIAQDSPGRNKYLYFLRLLQEQAASSDLLFVERPEQFGIARCDG